MPGSFATITPTNLDLGPCRVTYNSVDLGGTKGGVTITPEIATSPLQVDQLGDTDLDHRVSGMKFRVKLALAEIGLKDNWAIAFPSSTLVTNGADKKLVFDLNIGQSLLGLAEELVIHPLSKADADLDGDFTFPKAVVISPPEFKFAPDEQQVLEVEFIIYPTITAGVPVFGTYGDESIVAP
jgi:hypothetical protein